MHSHHRKSGPPWWNKPRGHSVLAVVFQRNPAPATAGDGVSTYLALTFGTLLSSQGTDASFETVSPVSPDVCPFGVSDSIRWNLTGVSECFLR
ncbi:hypothetical protein D8771_11155 [Streptomyces albus]|uniref:Uncharacterized protein n=1 Tax=Streptomyces albus TaxID=1888 RepID=A0A8H1QVJ1_9ACTN|nr:hypothetical protein D8771_11155 [Streptomyces albus]